MSNFNFFDWIRNGVRDSVLIGVNDAVNELGMPHGDSAKDKVLGFLKNGSDNETSVKRIAGGNPSNGKSKLGRGLSEIATKEAS
jgi:hypothetical protein